jgi:cephalosporin-C deacetylase
MHIRKASGIFLLFSCGALALPGLLSKPGQSQSPTVAPFNKTGIYDLGEKAGWTLKMPDGATSPAGKYTYTIKKNNAVAIQSGEVDLSSRAATIEVSVNEPAMLYMELTPPSGKPMVFGAAVAPTKLKPAVERPKDFDDFWNAKIAMLKGIPENPVVTPGESGKPDVDYSTIKMDHINGTHVYGQIAKPSKPGKYPALLVVQWASPPYPLQKSWAVDPAAGGWIVLNIEPHDVLPTEPPAYYAALPDDIKNYTSIGQTDRDKNYFLEMYLRGYRAVDYLASRPDWDGKTIVVTGGSMGGQQALAIAGLHPKVTHLMAEEPAGCDMSAGLHGRQQGYPFYPTNNPKVMEVAQYFDCINFAPRIKATSLIAMGFVDTVTPPCGIWVAFNLIPGPKVVAPMPEAPHNNTATWEQQQPYYSRYGEWLKVLAKGGKVELK